MDVVIFSECPTKDYYRSLIFLDTRGDINLEFRDSRFFYLFFLTLYSSFRPFRTFAHHFLGKPRDVRNPPTFRDVWKSLTAYFTLPFSDKTIVALFAPYSAMSYYLWFLRKRKRKIIFMSSWPFWEGIRGAYKPRLFSARMWEKFLHAVPAVTISKKGRVGLLEHTAQVVQIPHAVDLQRFSPGKKREKFSVLYLGRVIEEKGIRDLLEVAKELPDVQFTLVGSGALSSFVKDCSLVNVQYLGEVRDRKKVAQLFREHHLFVLNSYRVPGWEELYGIVLVEALASGTPVLATDCVGPLEIVRPAFGRLIPQRDPAALLEGILWYRDHPQKIGAMGEAGRAYAERYHDIRILSSQWYEVLLGKLFKL